MNTLRFCFIAFILLLTVSVNGQVVIQRNTQVIKDRINQYALWIGGGSQALNYSNQLPFSIIGGFEVSRKKIALDLSFTRAKSTWISSTLAFPNYPYYYKEYESKWQIDLLLKFNVLRQYSRSKLYIYTGMSLAHIKFHYAEKIINNYNSLLKFYWSDVVKYAYTIPLGISYEYRFGRRVSAGLKAQINFLSNLKRVTSTELIHYVDDVVIQSTTYGNSLSQGAFVYIKYFF